VIREWPAQRDVIDRSRPSRGPSSTSAARSSGLLTPSREHDAFGQHVWARSGRRTNSLPEAMECRPVIECRQCSIGQLDPEGLAMQMFLAAIARYHAGEPSSRRNPASAARHDGHDAVDGMRAFSLFPDQYATLRREPALLAPPSRKACAGTASAWRAASKRATRDRRLRGTQR